MDIKIKFTKLLLKIYFITKKFLLNEIFLNQKK